ncbi:MAG: multidrug efflux MFS transporter [Chloroflexota bacterium]|nr:multidrug efflux MFS transporter [Chloroflexota bacterium]
MIGRIPYKWLVAAVYVLGIFMNLLDLTITNVALPVMSRAFGVSATSIAWVATSYLLSVAVCIPVSGWLGDRFGTKRAFVFALAIFTLGSFLCGVVNGLGPLILCRVLQGVGGGLMTPVGAAMVFRAFPLAERSRVSVLVTIPAVVAPALGPVVGGFLVQYWTWHAIFLINVPIGVIGLIVAIIGLREYRVAGTASLDLPGFALATGGLASLVYALGEVGPRGIGDGRVLRFGLIGIAALVGFVIVERRVRSPMIDLGLYRDRLFTAGNITLFLVNGAFFGTGFIMPQFLQSARGLSPLTSGLTTFPTAVGIMLVAPLIGRLYPIIGPRRLVMAGALLAACAAFALRYVGLDTNLWIVRLQMLPLGIAFGLVFIPLQTSSFARISLAQTGRATAAYNAVRQVATSFGFALLATVLASRLTTYGATLGNPTTRDKAVAAFHDTLLVPALLSALAFVAAALLIRDHLAAETMRSVPLEGDATTALAPSLAME